MGVDGACQREGTGWNTLGVHHGPNAIDRCTPLGAGCKGSVLSAFAAKTIHVDLCLKHLRLKLVSLRFCKQRAVLVDKTFATEHDVLRAFAKAAAAEDIAADGARTLLCKKVLQISVLAYCIAVCTKVEDDVSAL